MASGPETPAKVDHEATSKSVEFHRLHQYFHSDVHDVKKSAEASMSALRLGR